METIGLCLSVLGPNTVGLQTGVEGDFWGNSLVVKEFVRLLGGGVARCEDVVFEH